MSSMDFRARERLRLGSMGQEAMDRIRFRWEEGSEGGFPVPYDPYSEATVLALLQIVQELRRER